MANEFEKFGLTKNDRLVVSLLEEIVEQMEEMNENLKKLLGARISPS